MKQATSIYADSPFCGIIFADLEGTSKQVKWADQIRDSIMSAITDHCEKKTAEFDRQYQNDPTMREKARGWIHDWYDAAFEMTQKTSAKWWIDNRDVQYARLLRQVMEDMPPKIYTTPDGKPDENATEPGPEFFDGMDNSPRVRTYDAYELKEETPDYDVYELPYRIYKDGFTDYMRGGYNVFKKTIEVQVPKSDTASFKDKIEEYRAKRNDKAIQEEKERATL